MVLAAEYVRTYVHTYVCARMSSCPLEEGTADMKWLEAH